MTAAANPGPTNQPGARPQRYQFSLRAVFVWVTVISVLLAVAVGGYRQLVADLEAQDRRLDKLERQAYIYNGTIDVESERGKGLFTDDEIDSMREELERLNAAPPAAP